MRPDDSLATGARRRWRILVIAGLAAMLLGAVDPLEGSLFVLPGAVAAALGTWIGHSRYRRVILWSLVLVAIGVAAMWGLSAVGGFGGTSGRSIWWGLAIVPYPVGWVLGVLGAVRCLRASDHTGQALDAH